MHSSPEEQLRLLRAADMLRSEVVRGVIRVLLLTGMRPGQALSLQLKQMDLFTVATTVGHSKTSNGTGRIIPLNEEPVNVIAQHKLWFIAHFGEPLPQHFFCPKDPRSAVRTPRPTSYLRDTTGRERCV
ncbi:MAG: tyrosine-type recombinase/integrase [Bryobacteraceae bacterium]